MATMAPSKGLLICMQAEGYADQLPDGSCRAYWDSIGCVWTIGYGSTGAGITSGLIWTHDQAVARLQQDWDAAQAGVLRASPILSDPANFNRLDAVTDFAYNEGIGHYQSASLRSYINRGDWTSAQAEFPKWDLAGGKVIPGLVTRRSLERTVFVAPVSSLPVPATVDSTVPTVTWSRLGRQLLALLQVLFQ
jgi:lysozyme